MLPENSLPNINYVLIFPARKPPPAPCEIRCFHVTLEYIQTPAIPPYYSWAAIPWLPLTDRLLVMCLALTWRQPRLSIKITVDNVKDPSLLVRTSLIAAVSFEQSKVSWYFAYFPSASWAWKYWIDLMLHERKIRQKTMSYLSRNQMHRWYMAEPY
jgi:hypothetical protein